MVQKVAVIGAGLAGLACARRLAAGGAEVTIYEKSRGPGGRMSTRRALGTSFDHGAQYFTVRDTGFGTRLAPLTERGTVAPFVARWGAGAPEDSQLWVGVPGMSAVGRALAMGLVLHAERRITGLVREATGWWLDDTEGRRSGPYARVAVAVPAPQVAAIDGIPESVVGALAHVRMEACLALMVTFQAPLAAPFDIDLRADPVLAFVCRNSAKPDRGSTEAWVLHADGEYSRDRLEADEPSVTGELLAAFGRRVGGEAGSLLTGTVLHRWRYARVCVPLDRDCLYDEESGVGLCGDWCLAARVEAAYQSGDALAGQILASR